MEKKTPKPMLWEEPGILVPIVFSKYGCFCSTRFLSNSVLHHTEITEIFHSRFIYWREPGKLVLRLFPKYGCFSSIRFSSYGLLHHKGHAWVFPSIFHSIGKAKKKPSYGKSLGNWYPYFSQGIGLLFHQILIPWYTPHHYRIVFENESKYVL